MIQNDTLILEILPFMFSEYGLSIDGNAYLHNSTHGTAKKRFNNTVININMKSKFDDKINIINDICMKYRD